MKIYIGADHRGFELKQKLIDWLKSQGHVVEDCGNTRYDPVDDYVDFAKCVAQLVLTDVESCGVVICGSGVGMSVMTNRHKGIYCALGFDEAQIQHARENDHINILALPANYISFEKACELIKIFLSSTPKTDEKYIRRKQKLDK